MTSLSGHKTHGFLRYNNIIKGAGRSAYLKIDKSIPLSLNHHNFSNSEPIYKKNHGILFKLSSI